MRNYFCQLLFSFDLPTIVRALGSHALLMAFHLCIPGPLSHLHMVHGATQRRAVWRQEEGIEGWKGEEDAQILSARHASILLGNEHTFNLVICALNWLGDGGSGINLNTDAIMWSPKFTYGKKRPQGVYFKARVEKLMVRELYTLPSDFSIAVESQSRISLKF